ncbi:hypothetical protein [Rossellomorea vietnamensis]|uniref:Uncharacterized protein n=1 Tax=Rossellomorea vietnamensis TaxID=218284 RepID=A0ACD4CBY3_9BACI|nr:hypothetical protein [Rossellomorea vietnamensis]UXH45117.1 hypothetical protein N5C46_03345 [Rossellomorea vietnamensis]WQI96475.1 hypothetical protein Q7C14_03460 [Rossellomorea vietnamensis]
MPKKKDENNDVLVQKNEEIEKLEEMLSAVLHYLSDDEIEEIDIEYLLTNTDNLREWWGSYREKNKKKLEDEIKKSLNRLSLEELENIREQIKNKNS